MLQFVLHFGHQQLLLCPGHVWQILHRPWTPPSFSTEAMTLITSTRIPTWGARSEDIHQSPERQFGDEKTQFRTNMFMTVSVATRINLRTTPLRNRSGDISTCSPRPLAIAHPSPRSFTSPWLVQTMPLEYRNANAFNDATCKISTLGLEKLPFATSRHGPWCNNETRNWSERNPRSKEFLWVLRRSFGPAKLNKKSFTMYWK